MTGAGAPRPVIDVAQSVQAWPPAPGGDPAKWLPLATNESPYGPSPAVAAAVAAAVEKLNRYAWPGANALREAIGRANGVDPDLIVCGNGSEDVIDNLVRTFLRAGDELLGPAYTWAGFAAAARRQGAVLVEAPLDSNWTPDVEAVLARLTPRTKMVFLANPGNPLGTLVGSDAVRRLVTGVPSNIVVCLDAAYAELVTNPGYSPGHEFVALHPNVVVTRTLSKVYGLAGARTGWVHAPRSICDALNSMRQMSVVPALVEAAAIGAVGDKDWMRECARRNAAVRADLTAKLKALDLQVLPSETNFVALRVEPVRGRSAADVASALFAEGIAISRLAAYGLPDWLRITLPAEKDVPRVVDALARALGRNTA